MSDFVIFKLAVIYHHLRLLLRRAPPVALKRLWGNKDYSMQVEEMLEEKSALQGVRSHSVMELIRTPTMRWQLLTIVFAFTTLQLCGITAVSDVSRATLTALWSAFVFFT